MKTFFVAFFLALSLTVSAHAANVRDSISMDYESVPAGTANQALGPTGAAGDILDQLIVTVNTTAQSAVYLNDGTGTSVWVTRGSTPIGVYSLTYGMRSQIGAWKITTDNGVSVMAVGRFR